MTPPEPAEELVLTPGGWRPKSKVHFVAPGQSILQDAGKLKIIQADSGKLILDVGEFLVAPDEKLRQHIAPPKAGPKKKAGALPAPITDQWIIYTSWTNNSGNPISYFRTRWIVPPEPVTKNGQTVFLFNGMQPTSGAVFILQPVLQWGPSYAGGGEYWTITNWFVDGAGNALHGSLIRVNPGDILEGIMTLTGQSGTSFSYLSSFTGFPSADLAVNNVNELDWACETLECYDFKAFSDYPNTALTAMYDIEILLRTATSPVNVDTDATINWQVNDAVTDNGQHCLVVSNDSPGGVVYLYYRNVNQYLYFITNKSSFGKDEVMDVIADSGGNFPEAFWVALEGFTINQLSINQPTPLTPALSGAFNTTAGITLTPKSSGPEYELPAELYTPQRICFPYDIHFTAAAFTSFPNPGDPPQHKTLLAAMTIASNLFSAATLFELLAGANPYFTNVDPAHDNVFWLSQDLRLFTTSPAIQNTPVTGGPQFSNDNILGAYEYIQQLLNHLNSNYSNPSGVDPFTSLIPDQADALTQGASVTPITVQLWPPVVAKNYHFAIARVRLRGTVGPSGQAQNVKVFFRLWCTQSADTDYQPASTYLSNLNSNNLPASPLPAPGYHTLPFFATGYSPDFNDPNNPELGSNGINNRTIQIPSGDAAWAYFGCFLNVYDSNYRINSIPVPALLVGTHHCIVAQIAYDQAPIINAGGITRNPENCDKLAQRNLQITQSNNPGTAATHRIPQTFDLRPSPAVAEKPGWLLDYPDELMIDWGNTPLESVASIYWPQVDTAQVLAMASRLYATHHLSTPEANTLQCQVTRGLTYIPIPSGLDANIAGLITIDLPPNVVKGQEFNIIVRRIRTRRQDFGGLTRLAAPKEPKATDTPAAAGAMAITTTQVMQNWRYVTGTFQIKIPVKTQETLLFPEENTLAVMKWRLAAMTPDNRWYAVLKRYVGYIADRVDGLGGNSAEIEPSLEGAPPIQIVPEEGHEFTGKVCEVIFDCFGDFVGFVMASCTDRRLIKSREKAIGEIVLRACKERLVLTVWLEESKPEKIARIVVRC